MAEYRANSAESTNNITTQLSGTADTFSKGPCLAPSPRASPSSPECEETGSQSPQGGHEVALTANQPITDASQDPRFDTFFKRLIWFKRKKESDKAFCERIGVPLHKYRGWKYRNYEPQTPIIMHLSEVLDVCPAWLAVGRGHRSMLTPGGRITEIPREGYFTYDDIDIDPKGDKP